ncbi:hypothetical protein AQUCO_02300072v1 [Aquilegia coerulea]|uniref:Uncharacterized protein n=1 Tax=Aquilegia coerulea TaxID=218851 RepID=A0A2G5DCU0_AQUCA|nr:hypothetical protein AQUCO_02300072v1 [Aquilegia coerulea]
MKPEPDLSAHDKAVDAAHSTKESTQQGQEQASGFIHQTSEQVMNMAHDAMDSVKSTLGVGMIDFCSLQYIIVKYELWSFT